VSAPTVPRGPGRPPAATREAVLEAARRHYLRGERIDIRAIAAELGLSRNTIYTWYGSREQLTGEVIVSFGMPLLARCREQAEGTGGRALVDTFDRFNRALTAAPALRQFVEREREAAVRVLTARSGTNELANVAAITALIQAEADAGTYDPPVEPGLLAYGIVRLAEAFLFSETALADPGELDRLRDIEAALLHVEL
jgi:AcrR family transcriptional regulator